MPTIQEEFWKSDFGDDYTTRNFFSPDELDASYVEKYGVSRSEMNSRFIIDKRIDTILEVGANVGNQLVHLQKQGFSHLYGIDVNEDAVEQAKQHAKKINIITGSAFDLPFRDSFFDMVFTSGVLIHINPDDCPRAMAEIYRTSKKYIWGFEYFAESYTPVTYRGHQDRLWKTDFAKLYMTLFPDLKLIKEEKFKYLSDANVDSMFLLEKV